MIVPEQCKSLSKNSKIVLEENLSKIAFTNPSRKQITIIRVDGCAITDGIRCDYMVLDDKNFEHYVELKGSDLDHAIAQIEETIRKISADKLKQGKVCFVITTRCPLLTTKIQELKLRFKKQYNSILIIKNRYLEHSL